MIERIIDILSQTEGLGHREFLDLRTYLLKLKEENNNEQRTDNTRERIRRLIKGHKS